MSGLNPSGLGRSKTFNNTEHESLDTEELSNEPVVSTGTGFIDAVGNLSSEVGVGATRTIHLTDDITIDSHIDWPSYLNLNGHGHRVTQTTSEGFDGATGEANPKLGFSFQNVQEVTIKNVTLKYDPSDSSIGIAPTVRIYQNCQPSLKFENVRAIGHDAAQNGHAWLVRHHANPQFYNCEGIGGSASKSHGWVIIHASHPSLYVCRGVGGLGGDGCHGYQIQDAANPLLSGCVGVGGFDGIACNGYRVLGGASPTLNNSTAKPKYHSLIGVNSGTDSFDAVRGSSSVDDDSGPDRAPDGAPGILATLEVRITTAVNGATVDVGTTAGGSEIASGVDASSTKRISPNINQLEVTDNDTIHVTPTDESVECNIRYDVAIGTDFSHAIFFDTNGDMEVSNSQFIGGRLTHGVREGSTSDSADNYRFANCTIKSFDPTKGVSLQSDSGSADGFYYCPVEGNEINYNPAAQ